MVAEQRAMVFSNFDTTLSIFKKDIDLRKMRVAPSVEDLRVFSRDGKYTDKSIFDVIGVDKQKNTLVLNGRDIFDHEDGSLIYEVLPEAL